MNYQEDFQFLLKNLNEKNDKLVNRDLNEDNFVRTKRALLNVINCFFNDFDKTSQSMPLSAIFHMIELYIQKYSEFFIHVDDFNNTKSPNVEKEFTSSLISTILRILANPKAKSLYSDSCKIIVLILEKFSLNSQYEFFNLIIELILALEDLNDFDKEFFDKNCDELKILNRFNFQFKEFNQQESEMKNKLIIIETPTHCSHLQENITFILKETCLQYISVLHEEFYEKLWYLICEQLKFGEKSLKIITYKLVLSILDLRILPLNKFDFLHSTYIYFIDCILATYELLFTDEQFTIINEDNIKSLENNEILTNIEQNEELGLALALITNRLFNNKQSFITNINDINNFLIHLIEIIRVSNFNNRSELLCNSFFSMIYNINNEKLQSNECKYLDVCILNDVADILINFLGKLSQINTYLNLIIAQGLFNELEINEQNNLTISNGDKSNKDIFKFDLNIDKIQTKLYKKLISKAKELLQTNKQVSSNTQEFKYISNGLNSIFEVFSYACIMCQNDPILIEEYKNPLIEYSKSFLFVQSMNNSQSTAFPIQNSNTNSNGDSVESIFIQLLLYWTFLLNDTKNLSFIHIPYSHALNTIKYLTHYYHKVEWKKNIAQNIVSFLSLPWLAHETNGLDLEFFKDKGYKQCSLNLIQNTNKITLSFLKRKCIQMLCLLPKNITPQWRTQIMSKCVKDESDEELRIFSLKYLPFLIHFLGVSSNSLVFQLIHPTMNEEKSLIVLKSYADLLNMICCLISRKTIIIRKNSFKIDADNLIERCHQTSNDTNKIYISEMVDHFELICTCCDRKLIDYNIIPKLTRHKNIEMFQILYNRPKNVDTQVLMQFIYVLSGNKFTDQQDENIIMIRSKLLQNLERSFNHLEFSRQLHQRTLVTPETLDQNLINDSGISDKHNTNSNLTYIYKEALNLFADESIDSMVRFDFSRFSIPKLICFNTSNTIPHQASLTNLKSTNEKSNFTINDENIFNALNTSVYSLLNQSDPQLDHNFNLENQLCEGFLRAKASKNQIDLYMYIIALGRFAFSLKKCDEYIFLCVKHLLEIFNSNEKNEWSTLASSLAQRQLFILSKRINMKELLSEFEENVCEIVSDTIYNSIKRHFYCYSQIKSQQSSNNTTLQNANYSLKDVLRVFNIVDSCEFVKSYQRFLVPYLVSKASSSTLTTISTGSDDSNYKIIMKSLDFLSRKASIYILKLIEDNFPYIFTYVTLNKENITDVFRFITFECRLDIDKLINCNKQRLFNELLSKCGNPKYKFKAFQAFCVLVANSDEAQTMVQTKQDDAHIIKAIEPNLLAALIHFDMCLLKSAINQKEKCQVLESLNVLMALLGPPVITKVRYKIMTTLKLAMQQCSKLSELNCKLWDTFLRNVEKSALGAILNQVSVNLLQLLDLQPYKISKIFEYLIIQNKEHLQSYFNELYFIPEHSCLQQVNQILKKFTDIKYIAEKNGVYQNSKQSSNSGLSTTTNNSNNLDASNMKALICMIKHYLKGAQHENADLRVKALEKLYAVLKEKSSQIIYMIERQENTEIISEIVLALLNGCRDSDPRAKLLFGSCLGEIGAFDPANLIDSNQSSNKNSIIQSNNNQIKKMNTSSSITPNTPNTSLNSSTNQSPMLINSNELILNPGLSGEGTNEFRENFSYSLIIELSKAYLAARHTHEQDSASYAIQECLKIYDCSSSIISERPQNTKLWNSFPDYFKEILVPLRTSKYEIQSFDNLGLLRTPIILSECKNYEEWVYKWCAYLISKIGIHLSNSSHSLVDLTGNNTKNTNLQLFDKELKVFPKLQFIIRFNVNVALYILPYVIITMIIQNLNEITDQVFEEIMSVIQLNQLTAQSPNPTATILPPNPTNSQSSKMLQYHNICCQTIFNIYDHLMRQLNYYRTKMNEIQSTLNTRSKVSKQSINNQQIQQQRSANEILLIRYKELFELFNKFIQRIPQQTISKAAFECKAYCRSLMHYELHMRNTPGAIQIQGSIINIKQEHLIELQNLFASMDEIDAASGILLLKKGSEESLADAAFRHKINGRLNESIACIEQMLESNENSKNDIRQHETYVRNFLSIGRHRNALSYLEGLMIDRSEWKEQLDSYRIEACWKLGSWDKLKQVLQTNDQLDHTSFGCDIKDLFKIAERSNTVNSFNAGIGKLFIHSAERNEKEFNETLCILREQQILQLSAVSMEAGGGSYQRGYEYVVNLQALQEIECCLGEIIKLRNDTQDKEQYRNLLIKNLDSYIIEPWEHKIQTMQPSFKHLEPIYNVRIALLNFLSSHLNINLSKQMAKLWLRLSKIARKAGMFENAYQYMLNAQGQIRSTDSNNLEELLVEKSKWYWQREDKDSALFYLQKGLNELFNNDTNSLNDISNNDLYSKVLLMYTKFGEENGSVDTETIRKNYLEVQKLRSKTEQAHFELAQFTDRLAISISENIGKKEKFWEYLVDIVSYYAVSLEFGCQYIYQSLPRMMSLWLDFGADYYDHQTREINNSRNQANTGQRSTNSLNMVLNKLNQIVSNALQRVPTYAFLTVYPQLVSRICHPEDRVFDTLSNIIMRVLLIFPCQAIWMLIAVKNSSVDLRKNRCKTIMDKTIRQQPDLRKFINDSSELAEKLVQLGNLNVEQGVTQLSLASCFKPLKRLVESKDFSRLLIPSQFQVTLQLPSNESGNQSNLSNNLSTTNNSSNMLNAQNQNFRTHNPYPSELVYISCFEDNVLVMNSLQKPKKVTIRGTDGKLYSFLVKSKDDLRIDYRIMEFFSVVNKCLKQEPESRRRNLYIRTYAVTPLNENSGIIEWIENLATLRSILIKLYAERGVGSVTSSEWKQHEEKISKDKDYALKVYKMFLDRYRPTVLYEWFNRTFSEPNEWYNARSNYVRTAAVMSVCGYVLGLGDRHCENILMASSNGDCIHVDFNCLFNKGETLGVPEIVPFRLTHNMIEAMGPLGYEGIYRKTCEVILKILRDYKEPLITILKTFIYDPLVEWKTPANFKAIECGETVSAKGQLHLQNITSRLKGLHLKQWVTGGSRVKALPLSVEGHVNTLIKEATDDKNLSLMYIGWSAFF